MWILDPDKVNVKEYNAEQEIGDAQIQTDKYKKIFETPVLKNGESNPTAFEWNWEEDLTGKNCLEALQMFMSKYNCEFIVRYESDSKNRITGRYIDIKKTIVKQAWK